MKRQWFALIAAALAWTAVTIVLLCVAGGMDSESAHAAPAQVGAAVLYVAPGGDCGGASPCYGTIQAAVDAADDGDTVKVAEGTYTSTVSEVVYIDSAITLIGGYAKTDWDQSDPETQPTIIDAEDAYRRGVYIDGSGVPTITLRALTVQRAKPEEQDGAGIFVQNATLLLQDSVVRDNSNTEGGGGGGLYARDCTMVLAGNTFQGNHAAGGGGLRVEGSSSVTISGNSVLSNGAFFGGGLTLAGSTVATVHDNTFRDNFGGEAGGIGVHDHAFVTLSGNTILSNTTAIDLSKPGGGLLVDGGTVVATGNHFEENSAFDGAGVYVDNPDGSVTLSENTIVNNHASTDGGKGGGLFVNHGTVLVQGNTIQDNNAAGGGGITISGGMVTLSSNQIRSNAAFFGGGLSVGSGAVVHLTGNTFRNNFGGHGGGLLVDGGTVQMSGNAFHDNGSNPDQGPSLLMEGGTVNAQNDILADSANADGEAVSVWGGAFTARHWTLVNNGSYALSTYGGSAVLTNTLVVSHTLGGLWGPGTVADTTLSYSSGTPCGNGASCTNNLAGDPRFVAPGAGDFHIAFGSAAMDAGVDAGVSSDMDGHHRPYNLSPDIGADELIATVVSPGSASTLVYTDTQGSPTLIDLPIGAVEDPITLVYTPVDTATAPSGLAFADHAFELEGYQGETPLPGLALQLPATVTIHFTETDVAGLSKASLVLTYWNEGTSAWEDAACGLYDRRPEDSWLAVPICHLSRFALFGKETHVYLPIVLRAP